jgi:putative hydrolase of the HAD superfamily
VKVFFDIDGVLIRGWHARPERRRPWDAQITEDLGIDGEIVRRMLFEARESAPSAYHACAIGEHDLKDVLAEILPHAGYRGSVDAYLRYWFEHDAVVDDQVLDVVRRLSRRTEVELYIATIQEHHRAAFLWNEVGFREHFRDIWYSARVGHLKYSPEYFTTVNAALAIGPQERPLFFDDTEEVVAVACAAGWDAHVFDSIDDLRRNPRIGHLL